MADIEQKYKENVTIIASCEADKTSKSLGCGGLLYNCIFSKDAEEFEANYGLLVKYQRPFASFGGKKAAPI